MRALDSDECGAWLCKLLEGREGMRTTSHSLESTTLSCYAKYGIGYEDRLALGGHSHPYRMADVYSRDALARPLRLLDEVLTEIWEHRFFPDCTRAGRFADVLQRNDPVIAAEPLEGPSQRLVKEDTLSVPSSPGEDNAFQEPSLSHHEVGFVETQCEGESDANSRETSSDSGSSSTSDSEDPVPGNPKSRILQAPSPLEGYRFLQRSKVRTLRYQRSEHCRFTLCGRKAEAPLGQACSIRYDTPVCGNCKKAFNTFRVVGET